MLARKPESGASRLGSGGIHSVPKNTLYSLITGLGLLSGAVWHISSVPPRFEQTPLYSQIPLSSELPGTVAAFAPKSVPAALPALPASAPRLSPAQQQVLHLAVRIGQEIGVGPKLAAVAYQESSLGLFPQSPAHYGVGSVGYTALQTVLKKHPWLQPDFRGRNWAQVLAENPAVSLWVAGYYLQHCYHLAGNDWQAALDRYRYGIGRTGTYPFKIARNEQKLSPYLT